MTTEHEISKYYGVQMKLNSVLLSALVLGLSACGGDDKEKDAESVVCTQEQSPGISVTVFDAETNLPISCGATVVINDGNYLETVTEVNLNDSDGNCLDEGPLQGAIERTGDYMVTVSQTGYQDFIDTNVMVSEGVCGVVPVEIKVSLSR